MSISSCGKLSALRKRKRYTVEEKLTIVEAARTTSFKAAQARFGVSRSSLHEWMRLEPELVASRPSAMRTIGNISSLPQLVLAGRAKEGQPIEVCDNHATIQDRDHRSACIPLVEEVAGRGDVSSVTIQHGLLDQHATTLSSHPSRADTILIGYQGELGGFTEIAARRTFQDLLARRRIAASTFELTGFPRAHHALNAVAKDEIDYVFVPTVDFFNPLVTSLLDRAVALRLRIVGEVSTEEKISVCALPGTELRSADCIVSDWRLLSQHDAFIAQLEKVYHVNLYRQVAWDSGTACRIIQDEHAENTLALCSDEAGRDHGLVILEHEIPTVTTTSKYIILGRQDSAGIQFGNMNREGASSRTGTLFLTSTDPAAFFRVVTAFVHLDLPIKQLTTRGFGDLSARTDHSCVISYRVSPDAVVESTLDTYLSAAAERVVHLGNYFTYDIQDDDPYQP